MVMRFNGPGPPAYVPRALKAGRAAGVILFKDNIASQADLKRLVRTLQRAAGGSALVSTDQEGGEIRNLTVGAARSRARPPRRRPSARPPTPAARPATSAPPGSTSTSRPSATSPRAPARS